MNELTPQQVFKRFEGLDLDHVVHDSRGLFEGWRCFREPNQDTHPDPVVELREVIRKRDEALEQRGREMEALRKEAQEEREGILLKDQEISRYVDSLTGIITEFERIKQTHWQVNSRAMVDFAFALAEKMVLRTVKTDPAILSRHIEDTLATLKGKDPVEVHLSQGDLEYFKNSADERIRGLLSRGDVKWIGDARYKPGELVVDTEKYRLDISIQTVIENISEALLDMDNGGPVETP